MQDVQVIAGTSASPIQQFASLSAAGLTVPCGFDVRSPGICLVKGSQLVLVLVWVD